MIRVYSTPDGRARIISFDDAEQAQQPPLELVRSFPDEESEEAWRLLHELGGEPDAACRTRGGPPCEQPGPDQRSPKVKRYRCLPSTYLTTLCRSN